MIMYSEKIELTYSHLDLGALNEYGLMCLFGSMHSKALVYGLDLTVEDIKDHHGRRLYPAYFHTHLKVPKSLPLSRFGAWRHVQTAIDLKRFGKCYLDSSYVIKPGNHKAPEPIDFTSGIYPTMHGNNLFIVDVTEDSSVARQLAVPESSLIASLDSVSEKPIAIQSAKEVSRNPIIKIKNYYRLISPESIAYKIVPERDVALGHAMIFARFCQVMDYAEFVFFDDQLEIPFGDHEFSEYSIVEREIFYFNNAYKGDTVDVGVKACVTSLGDGPDSQYFVETEYQMFRRSNLDLLAVGYAKKQADRRLALGLLSKMPS